MNRAVNSVELVSEADVIKQGDTANFFLVKLLDKDGEPVDVSDATVTWNLTTTKKPKVRVIADKTAIKEPETGVVRLTIDSSDSTGFGRFETEIIVEGTRTEIFPAAGDLFVNITANSQNLEESNVAYATISYFQDSVSTTLSNSQQAVETANQAKQSAESAQAQVSQFAADTTGSDAMSLQATVRDVNGQTITFGNLKERADDTDAQLADITPHLKSFGAVLDGVTDDSGAINNYLNNLTPTNGRVREIILPDKTIAISKIVIKTPNVVLKGRENTILKKVSSSPNKEDFISIEADGVTVKNIQFNDNGKIGGYLVNANYEKTTVKKNLTIENLKFKADNPASRGIIVGYYDGVNIKGCNLENTTGVPDGFSYGIAVWSQKDLGDNTMQTKNIFVTENKIIGFYHGINSWGTGSNTSGNRQRVHIERNIIEGCTGNGINGYHTPRSLIAHNHVRNCGDIGIWSDSGNDYEYNYNDDFFGTGNRVLGNYVQSCRVGILTEEIRYGVISQNTVFRCTEYGIGIGGGTNSTTVSYNTVFENGHGIYVDKNINPNNYYIFDLELSGNIVKRNKHHGIRVGGVRKTIKINGGFVTDNGTVNVGVSSPSVNYAGIWVGKDGVNSNGTATQDVIINDVSIQNGYNVDQGVTITGKQDNGIYLQQGAVSKVAIRDSDFANHQTEIYGRYVTQGLVVQGCWFLTSGATTNLYGSSLYTSGNVGHLTEYRNGNGNLSLSGRWDGDHLIMNGHHLWIEGGKMYIKSSKPNSATDGTILGTQS